MRPEGLIKVEGSPTSQELAALTAALSALLDAERPEAVDSDPLAYRSLWRRAGVVAATTPFDSGRAA